MDKQEIIAVLRRELDTAASERRAAKSNPRTYAARTALRRFQSGRMARTHADLLAARETHAAAGFFLSDLYGPHDLTQRDTDLERAVPTMERILPVAALQAITKALALDALSETLDAAMAHRLGDVFTEEDYIAAYRQTGSRADRERQLALVASVGNSLCELAHIPLVGSILKVMRGPARLAKLNELQSFLERGLSAVGSMKKPERFVETIVQRERLIMDRLYSGAEQPFMLPQ